MSEIKVNKISPKQTCTQLTLGDSGDTIIIPAGATITNNGTATGFGATYNGTVNWDTTAKTTGFTAVSGVGYFCNTTGGAFTVTLPLSPTAGAVVAVADYANTFATNNLTLGRNGSNIAGSAVNSTISTNGISVTFVYVDATQGWLVTDSGERSNLPTAQFVTATGGTITTSGNFKIHTFTGPGTFAVSNAGNPIGSTTIDYLVVAGGGGGGSGLGGGGGAGGYRTNFPSSCAGIPVSVTSYPITVGGGGALGAPDGGPGNNGSDSVFSTITSTGGGGSRGRPVGPVGPGGSGGGSAGAQTQPGGSGNTPPVSPSQGNNGGAGQSGTYRSGGGGGGAGAVGGDSSSGLYGTGGVGAPNSISGSAVFYAGGGGGNGDSGGPAPSGLGGNGGGGAGGPAPGTPGTTNTGGGGGGGGAGSPNSGAGGSGIVIIRYKFQ